MDQNKWHVEKAVRLDMVLVLVLQLLGGIYWASNMEARTTQNTKEIVEIKGQLRDIPDRLTRVETQVVSTSDMVHDIRDRVWTITNTRK